MEIKNIKILEENNWTKVQADITWGDDNSETAFFAAPSNLSNELDICCADNFLVGLMLIAINRDEDIHVQGAGVSKILIKNIQNILIPTLAKMKCGTGKTKIYSKFVESENQIRGNDGATGISLGVDSFYSILKYIEDKTKPINTVLYVHQVQDDIITIDKGVQERFDTRKKVADGLSLKFIPIVTNLQQILDKEFVFTQYHTFCHLASAMSIKSIAYYYYATGFSLKEMRLCFDDTAYYDNIITQVIRHNNFSMEMSGDEVTRFEKTELISRDTIVQKFLDVCLKVDDYDMREKTNCSVCHKCTRTLATLEVLGNVSKFEETFDLKLYNKTRYKAWGDLQYRKVIMKDEFALEIFQKAKSANLKLPLLRWMEFFRIGIHNQFYKIFK